MKAFMTVVVGIVVAGLVASVAGCSGQARQDYYEAVAVSSVAHANIQTARYVALSNIAAGSEDGQASKVAAVMAIAMLKQTTIQPAYIESEALSWGKVLAAPIAGITALAIQADVSNNNVKQQNKTARAQISASTVEQGNLLNALSADDGSAATTDLAIGGIIDISNNAMGTVEDVVLDSNDLIYDLSNSLQPIVPVEITPIVEIVPIANPNPPVTP